VAFHVLLASPDTDMLRRSLLLLAAAVLGATTLERLDVDQMVQRSSAVVQARVLDGRSYWRGRTIYTNYRLQISKTIKGYVPATTEVSVPGGTIGDLRQHIPGAPKLTIGQEYVIFLWKGPSGTTHLLGLSQGLFNMEIGADGTVRLSRSPVEAVEFVDAQGRETQDRGVTLTLADLERRVSAWKSKAQEAQR